MNFLSANTNSCFRPLAHGIPLITINAIVSVLRSLRNVLVCLAIATNPPLRRASNYFLFSLAIADLIITLVCEPLIVEFIGNLTFFHGCITSLKQLEYNALVSLSCQTSIIHLTTINFDRFVAVGFPLRHKIFMEKGGLKVMLIVSWSIPILASVLSFIIPPASSPVLSFGLFYLCLQRFKYFLFSLSGCGSFAPPQENNKTAKSSNGFFETDYPHRGPCYLHTGYRNRRLHHLLSSSNDCTCVCR